MAAFAGDSGPEQRMRKRHISLSAESPAAPHEVRVAAGTATVLLFDSPLLPASLELATTRQRFERIDVTETALVVVPRQDLTPQERVLLTVRFADGHMPHRVTFAFVSRPGEVDLQLRVFRTSLAPEALVEELGTVQARCEDAGRFANFLFSRRPGGSIVVQPLLVLEPKEQQPLVLTNSRAFIAPGFLAVELTLMLAKGQSPWRLGRVEVWQADTRKAIPVRTRDMDSLALQPGRAGSVVLELPAGLAPEVLPLEVLLHEQGGDRLLTVKRLGDVTHPGAGP